MTFIILPVGTQVLAAFQDLQEWFQALKGLLILWKMIFEYAVSQIDIDHTHPLRAPFRRLFLGGQINPRIVTTLIANLPFLVKVVQVSLTLIQTAFLQPP